MQVMVYVEDYQIDCCGNPFAVGEIVEWDCVKGLEDYLVKADYFYEAHLESKYEITGKVVKIYALTFEIDENSRRPISYSMTPKEQAHRFGAKNGYLVELDNVKITE